jgi:hypothetical protein
MKLDRPTQRLPDGNVLAMMKDEKARSLDSKR